MIPFSTGPVLSPLPQPKMLAKYLGFVAVLVTVPALHALPPVLLKDLDPASFKGGSNPAFPTVLGSSLFFLAENRTHGRELWKTDGTASGTIMVRDIAAGTGGLATLGINGLTAAGSLLFFAATDGTSGLELWKSDGTAAGTLMVKDINPGSAASSPSGLTAVGSMIYFVANNGVNGRELWKSDGTAAGTVMVKDITAGAAGSELSNLFAVGPRLHFSVVSATRNLWKSDGTGAGTVLVKNVSPENNQRDFASVGGTFYFRGNDGTSGSELWKSDGTTAGTVLVRDLVAGSAGSEPGNLAVLGTTLFFTADDQLNGRELWKSDGTAAGTVLVKDLAPGAPGSGLQPRYPVVVGGVFYFAASSIPGHAELWKSDGTSGGTLLVKSVATGGMDVRLESLVGAGNQICFKALDGSSGTLKSEVWRSDGTAAGTFALTDALAGAAGGSGIGDLNTLGGQWFFAATEESRGQELWKTDGTPAGTALLKDIAAGTADAGIQSYGVAGEALYLMAKATPAAQPSGFGLWKSDGSPAGTAFVKTVYETTPFNLFYGTYPGPLFSMADVLYFPGRTDSTGVELWSSDGTTAGTSLFADLFPGAGSSGPLLRFHSGGKVFFTANQDNLGTTQNRLWQTDGTAVGTQLAPGFPTGANWLPYGGGLFYGVFSSPATGAELWKSDGTAAGFRLVRDIRPGTGGSFPTKLTMAGGTLYFVADDGVSGEELWKSDGTEAGTLLVRELRSGANFYNIRQMGALGNTLYFIAEGAGFSTNLWKSDGTNAGTTVLKSGTGETATLGAEGPQLMATAGNLLFFTYQNRTTGLELWQTDGTSAATAPIKDIWSGPGSSDPRELTDIAGRLYFSANDGSSGRELWTSDGTAGGTVMIADLTGDSGSSSPSKLRQHDQWLYFAATTEIFGQELYQYALPIPEIAVLGNGLVIQAGDTSAASADGTDFGNTNPAGGTTTRSFTIQNRGGANLSLSSITFSGPSAPDFSLTSAPASPVAPQQALTFGIRFTPSTPGTHTAIVTITSNDPDEGSYTFLLSGTALTPAQKFSSILSLAGLTGADAAPDANPFQDGVPNLLKYAFNLNLQSADNRALPAAGDSGTAGLPVVNTTGTGETSGLRLTYLQRKGSGLIYTPKHSASLDPSSFVPFTAPPTITSLNDTWERVTVTVTFGSSTPPNRRFAVVQVSLP